MNDIISIIVPVYNVEDYIEECIKSILGQTYSNYEIIIVNDGSSDKSIEKIKKIEDKRIKLINQTNKGLSAARNIGLKNSIGKYVVFLDSDDYWKDKNYLKNVIYLFNKYNCDVVIGKSIRIYEDKEIYHHCKYISDLNKTYMNIKEFLYKVIDYNWIPVWLYCFNLEIIKKNDIYFKEGFLHEDEDFTPRVLLKAKNIAIYNESFYGYRQREGSITKTFSEKNIKDILKILMDLDKEYNTLDDEELKLVMKKRTVKKFRQLIYNNNYLKINKEMRKFLLENSKGKEKVDALLIYIYPKLFFYKEVAKYKLGIE